MPREIKPELIALKTEGNEDYLPYDYEDDATDEARTNEEAFDDAQ